MCPKRYLSLWYVSRKPCTHLTSELTPSRNGLNEIPQDPRHLGVPLGASKLISKPMVCSTQSVQLYCINANTISKHTKMRFHMTTSPRSSIRCVQKISKPKVRLTQTAHLYCVKISTISKRTKRSFHLRLAPRSTIGTLKTMSKPMVHLAQTVHLSSIDTNTISKRCETRFHKTHVS